MRKAQETIQSTTLREAAAATDVAENIEGKPGIEEPLGEADKAPDTPTQDDVELDGTVGPPNAGDALQKGADLLGMASAMPGEASLDADAGYGRMNPLADGEGNFSMRTDWTDVMDSDGNQSITGYEHYETDRYSTDIITKHEDGVTSQDVTRTDKQTGEVIHETSTDEPPSDDTSTDDGDVGVDSGDDTTPDPIDDDGGDGQAVEAFRAYTDQHFAARTPYTPGAESLQQPPEGEGSTIPSERPPRQVGEEVMKSQLDPYIQHTEDHMDIAELSPKDLVFENTLIDPDPIVGTGGGLSGLIDPPDELGPGPEEDGIGEVDLDS